MGLTRWYLQIQQYFERKYGESVVVLMQVGKFFECYPDSPHPRTWFRRPLPQGHDFQSDDPLRVLSSPAASSQTTDPDWNLPHRSGVEVMFSVLYSTEKLS